MVSRPLYIHLEFLNNHRGNILTTVAFWLTDGFTSIFIITDQPILLFDNKNIQYSLI